MNIVFLGTGEIGLPALEALADAPEHELLAVFTQPDKPFGRRGELKPPAPNPKTKADEGRKRSFCARMAGVVAKSKNADRAKASMKRWKCP